MYFFTADEHYSHTNICKYTDRPFESTKEMDSELIKKHNSVVSKGDIVIHAGDFTLINNPRVVHQKLISKLKGQHIFLKGSHDKWLTHNNYIFSKTIDKQHIVVCHYCMRIWHRSHYNSWHLYGHSHGKLEPIGKSLDIGVDNHNFYPWSLDEIINYMNLRPDNPNFIKPNFMKKPRKETNGNNNIMHYITNTNIYSHFKQ